MPNQNPALLLNRSIICVHGKGGVGKTSVSLAIACALKETGVRTLWVSFEEPHRPQGQTLALTQNLWHHNCEMIASFQEYVQNHLPLGKLGRIFSGNSLIQYLVKAAPGLREMILIGKAWDFRKDFDRVVIDMPSMGYAVAMFQSLHNFNQLFSGGLVRKNTREVLDTFESPQQVGHLIVALPEETPLRESLDLDHQLNRLFPKNPPNFWVNARFPWESSEKFSHSETPYAKSPEEYFERRNELEIQNLKLWSHLSYFLLTRISECEPASNPISPLVSGTHSAIVDGLAKQILFQLNAGPTP